jgi:hypothetical protein
MKLLSAVLAALPFAFALFRAVQTGTDVRYVWVALAAMAGGMLVTARVRGSRRPVSPQALAAAVFLTAVVFATGAGMLLGTRLGPGLLVVTTAFAACFAAASFTSVIAGRR